MNRRRARRLLPALALAALAGGCATYGEQMAEVERHLTSGHPERALTALGEPGGDDASLLELLHRGVVLRQTGDYAASIAAFEAAKQRMRALEPLSISGAAASVTVTEGIGEYPGEVHERLFLHVMQALNFLERDDLDAARVEARQIDLTLRRLGDGEADGLFGADAFPRYLAGIIFEAGRQHSDAMIAYRKAYQAYTRETSAAGPVPADLEAALVRLAKRQGLDQELADYRERFGSVAAARGPGPEDGQLVFVLLAGLAPEKRERSVMAHGGEGALVRISLPHYRPRPPSLGGVRLHAGGRSATTERVASVAGIAQRVLEARLPALTARAAGRNVVKNVAAHQLGEEHPGLGLLARLAGLFLEQADTRSWRTLPDHFQLARLTLPAGRYDVTVSAASGAPIKTYEDLPVRAGGVTVRSGHWLSN